MATAPKQGSRISIIEPQSLVIRSGDSLALIIEVVDENGALQDLSAAGVGSPASVVMQVFNYVPQSGDPALAGPFNGALGADVYHSLITMPVGTLITRGLYKLQTVVSFPTTPAIQLTDISDLQVG